jgi:hypothetical protein
VVGVAGALVGAAHGMDGTCADSKEHVLAQLSS